MTGRPPVEVVTPEGPATVIPTRQPPRFWGEDWKRPAAKWVLVEYPDGRRRYWSETQITVEKP